MTLIAALRHRGFEPRHWGAKIRRVVGGVAFLAGVAAVMPVAVGAQDAGPVAQDRPVLLELYTAQGCASCPPADAMMHDLAARDDVIALALHVDYWDYIGWADTFADPAHTQRQQRYARRHGHSTIYTPQVVVNGIDIVEGYRAMAVMNAIASQQQRAVEVDLRLTRAPGGGLAVTALPLQDAMPPVAMASRRSAMNEGMQNALVGRLEMSDAPTGTQRAEPEAAAEPQVATAQALPAGSPFVLQMVRYRPEQQVEILRGENAGRMAHYANVVTDWQVIGGWDMRGPLEMTVPLAGDEPVVVLIQETGQGEIVAAARLR